MADVTVTAAIDSSGAAAGARVFGAALDFMRSGLKTTKAAHDDLARAAANAAREQGVSAAKVAAAHSLVTARTLATKAASDKLAGAKAALDAISKNEAATEEQLAAARAKVSQHIAAEAAAVARLDAARAKLSATNFAAAKLEQKTLTDVAGAAHNSSSAFSRMHASMSRANTEMRGMTASALPVLGFAAVLATAAVATKKFADASDGLQQTKDRLRLFASEGVTATGILNGLNEAAARSNAPLGALSDIYNRNAAALQAMGKSEADGIRMTETLYKSLVISGNATESGTAALKQFSQSLNSGQFRGEEFNSVNEQATQIIRTLAKEFNVSQGQLREWAKEGKLTAEVVYAALASGAADIDAKFAQMQQTIGQASTTFKDTFAQVAGGASEATGANKAFTEAINQWTELLKSDQGVQLMMTFANGFKTVAEYAGYAADKIREFVAESKRREQAGQGWFERWFGNAENDAGILGNTAARGLGLTLPGGGENNFRSQALIDSQMKGSVYKDDIVSASAGDKKTPEELRAMLGKGEESAAAKRLKKLREEIAKNLEQEKLRSAITDAQIAGDGALETKLRNQLEIRSRITDEMRKADPIKAAALEREIEQQNTLETVLKNRQELEARNLEFANAFSSTITNAFNNAVSGGQSFMQTLKQLGKELLMVTAKAALLDPLQRESSSAITGFMRSSGIDIGTILRGAGGAGGDVGLGSWAPTIAMADGGILNSPSEMPMVRAAENGAEAIMPLARDGSGRLGVVAAGGAKGGGNVYNLTTIIQGDATDATVMRLESAMRAQIARAMPDIVETSVYAMRDAHVADPSFMRR